MRPVQVPEKVVTEGRHSRDCTARSRRKSFFPVWRKGSGKTNHLGSEEQDEPQISVRGVAWDAKQQRTRVRSGLVKFGDWTLRTGGY